MAFDWTAARVERLHHLLTQEHAPYSLIAEQLGREAGERLSRNAISGKIDRLRKDCPGNWPLAVHSPGPPKPRVRRPRPAKRTDCWQSNGNGHASPPTPLKPTPKADRAIAPAQRRMISELSAYDRRCRWPIGDPQQSDFYFCGATSKADRPYCARHCKEAYMPDRSKKDRPDCAADRSTRSPVIGADSSAGERNGYTVGPDKIPALVQGVEGCRTGGERP